jgi:hypothetical protein
MQYHCAAGCGNTPYEGKGSYHDRLYSDIAHKPFCEAQFQPQLIGVTLSVKCSPEIACSAHQD